MHGVHPAAFRQQQVDHGQSKLVSGLDNVQHCSIQGCLLSMRVPRLLLLLLATKQYAGVAVGHRATEDRKKKKDDDEHAARRQDL